MKNLAIFLLLISFCSFGQIEPPFYFNSDNLNDTIGWSHYAEYGEDDWEFGLPWPYHLYNNYALSGDNVFGSNLDNVASENSLRYMEMPEFDFTNANDLIFRFHYQCRLINNAGFFIQYSLNNGSTWENLNREDEPKTNWCYLYNSVLNDSVWTGQSTVYRLSAHGLSFLNGESSVKIRFCLFTEDDPSHGVIFDNISITENSQNLKGLVGEDILTDKLKNNFDVTNRFLFNSSVDDPVTNYMKFYLSEDEILDASDLLLDSADMVVSSAVSEFTKTIDLNQFFPADDYYILTHNDMPDSLAEFAENDNVSISLFKMDTLFEPGYFDNFEGEEYWQSKNYDASKTWHIGNRKTIHQIGSLSGEKSWYLDGEGWNNYYNYLVSPQFNLLNTVDNYFCFWINRRNNSSNKAKIFIARDYHSVPSYTSNSLSLPDGNWRELNSPDNRRGTSEWDCDCLKLDSLDGHANTRIYFTNSTQNSMKPMAIDDVYIGPAKPDLSCHLENSQLVRFHDRDSQIDTVFHTVFNSGASISGEFSIEYFYSTDSIFDNFDTNLGFTNHSSYDPRDYNQVKFGYDLGSIPSDDFFIIAKIDPLDEVDELTNINNVTIYPIKLAKNFVAPYTRDFESVNIPEDWYAANVIGSLNLELNNNQRINSGSNLNATIDSFSLGAIYLPSFDLTAVENPVLTFDMNRNFTSINVSYSLDNGDTWEILDQSDYSFSRWYSNEWDYVIDGIMSIPHHAGNSLYESSENVFFRGIWIDDPVYAGLGGDSTYQVNLSLNEFKNEHNIKLRFNVSSNLGFLSIDNFSIVEGAIDLSINYSKQILQSSMANSIKLSTQIRNTGNLASEPCVVGIYLSSDSIMSSDDLLIDYKNLRKIRPGLMASLIIHDSIFGSYSDYSYVIFNIDELDEINETDEVNNTVHWELSLDSISSYPYLQTFSDSIINGWPFYTVNGSGIQNTFRENGYQWRTYDRDIINSRDFLGAYHFENLNRTRSYLETPSFNFGQTDSMSMSFKYFVSAGTGEGAIMEYSINGGNDWEILRTPSYGNSFNWYNHDQVSSFSGEDYWNHYNINDIDSMYYNISFLRGEENVVFRYHQLSDASQGSYLDDFLIENHNDSVDYFIDPEEVEVNINSSDINIDFTIENILSRVGRSTNYQLWYSTDSILNMEEDEMVKQARISAIEGFDDTAVFESASVIITQELFYIFVKIDSDNEIVEKDEGNNIKRYKISHTPFTNIEVKEYVGAVIIVDGPTVEIDYEIRNTGSIPASNFTNSIYLSSDHFFDNDDELIESFDISNLIFGDTLRTQVSFDTPEHLEDLDYFFIVFDSDNGINELNESDNLVRHLITGDNLSIDEVDVVEEITTYFDGNNILIKNIPALDYKIELLGINGKILQTMQSKANQTITFSGLYSKGTYIVRGVSAGEGWSEKVLVH